MNILNAMVLAPGSVMNLPSFYERVEQALAQRAALPPERSGYIRTDLYKIEEKRYAICGANLSLVEFVLDACGLPIVTHANQDLAEEALSLYLRQVVAFLDRNPSLDVVKIYPMGVDDAFLATIKADTGETDVYTVALLRESGEACRLLKTIVCHDSAQVAGALKAANIEVPGGALEPFSRAITLGALTGIIIRPCERQAENEVAA